MSLELWDRAAAEFAASVRAGRDGGRAIYAPTVIDLLGDVQGRHVLDAGCGEGFWTRWLVEHGARVTAIDGSREMLLLARESLTDADQSQVDWRLLNLEQPLDIPDASVDLVLASMVLMDLPTIDTAIHEFARVLAPGGALILAIPHPCYFICDWITDGEGRFLYKIITDYLNERVETLTFWGLTMHYHRPLSGYFSVLERAGLVVEALREPRPTTGAGDGGAGREHHQRIPSFLVLRAALRAQPPQEAAD